MNKKDDKLAKKSLFKNFRLTTQLTILIVVLAMWIFLALTTDTFLTRENIANLFRQTSLLGIVAVGLTFVIISGHSDLSMGATIGVSGIITAQLLRGGMPLIVVILAAIALGIAIGTVNGLVIIKGEVPAFIATLSTMTALRGVAYLLSNGQTIAGLPDYFNKFSGANIWIIPSFVFILIIVLIIGHFVLSSTVFGRNLYAVGSNKEVAALSGIKVYPMVQTAYMISGMLAALAGVLLTSRLASGQPMAGNGYDLQCVTAVVIGGGSLSGGKGSVMGTFIGTLLIYTLYNGGNLLNVNAFWLQIVIGVMTILAVFIDGLRRRRASRA